MVAKFVKSLNIAMLKIWVNVFLSFLKILNMFFLGFWKGIFFLWRVEGRDWEESSTLYNLSGKGLGKNFRKSHNVRPPLHANHIMMWVDANTTNLQILNSTYIVMNFINFFDVKICYFFCISITLIIVHLLELLVLSFCNICICYFIPLLIETTNKVLKSLIFHT